jgi:hypothetical protein
MTESQLRQRIKLRGYLVRKARGATHADNYGGFQIIDPYNNSLVRGEKYDLDLDDLEAFYREVSAAR